MNYSDAKKAANRRYNEKTYSRIILDVPKEDKPRYQGYAEASGMSLRAYVIDAIEEKAKKDGLK